MKTLRRSISTAVPMLAILTAAYPTVSAEVSSARDTGVLTKLPTPFTVNGEPILGTYSASTLEELAAVKDVGMNVILGGHDDLDPSTERGRFLKDNGIMVMHHMTQHIYGKPKLRERIGADQTTIPLTGKVAKSIPQAGVIQIEDERIRYGKRSATALIDCRRGYGGTKPAAHDEGIILFWPDACEAEVRRVKDAPNLWGYYVLDDSPGDAISALRAMYGIIRRVDGEARRHPVCAGYGSAGSLCNFGAGVCDIMMIYWYPVSSSGYHRAMTSHEVQWMLATARARVPGVPFVGVYQAFNGGSRSVAIPTRDQLREQLEDFIREGACGLIAFLCRGAEPLCGWASQKHMQEAIRQAHREIRKTGGLRVRPETEAMRRRRVQPAGHWTTPKKIPGVVPAWHVIGPFDDAAEKGLEVVFPPEKEIDLAGVYEGKWGKVRWITRLSHGGVVGLCELYGSQIPHAAAYGTCTVTSLKAQKVKMAIGSDDDAIIWLNGSEVWWHSGSRGIERDNDLVDVELPAGESRILIKSYNRAGMWAFFMRFLDLNGRPLDGLRFSPSDLRPSG